MLCIDNPTVCLIDDFQECEDYELTSAEAGEVEEPSGKRPKIKRVFPEYQTGNLFNFAVVNLL